MPINTFQVPPASQKSFYLLTLLPKNTAETLGTELLSVGRRIWHHCCPHNELQCESCSNYDSLRRLTGENWAWIFHNLHLLFKWEIIMESHANFCHGPEFPITVIGKVSEGALKMRGDEISDNANYQTPPLYQLFLLHYWIDFCW